MQLLTGESSAHAWLVLGQLASVLKKRFRLGWSHVVFLCCWAVVRMCEAATVFFRGDPEGGPVPSVPLTHGCWCA